MQPQFNRFSVPELLALLNAFIDSGSVLNQNDEYLFINDLKYYSVISYS